MVKILIAVPTYENIMPDTFKSIYDLDKCGHECIFEFMRGYDCAKARNTIAQRALNLQADYVLMLDNDMTLPTDALKNLLDEDKDVCFGYCARRIPGNEYDGVTCVYKNDGEFCYSHMFPARDLKTIRENGINKIQVHGCGAGCVLIKTDVFRRLPFPWFKWITYENREELSEDLFFCELCNQHGIPLYVDTRVSCGHLFRDFVYTE